MPKALGHSGQPFWERTAPLKVSEASGGPTVPERLTSPPGLAMAILAIEPQLLPSACRWGHQRRTQPRRRGSRRGCCPRLRPHPSRGVSALQQHCALPPSLPSVPTGRCCSEARDSLPAPWAPTARGGGKSRGRVRADRASPVRPPVPPRGANPAPRPRPAALPSTLVRVSTGLLQALRGATLAECFFMASPSPAAAPRRPAPTSWRRRSPPGRRSRHGPAAARRLPARRPLPQHRAAAAAGAGARPPARCRSGLPQTTRHGAARSPQRSRGRPRVEGGVGARGAAEPPAERGGAPGALRLWTAVPQRPGPAPPRECRGSERPASGLRSACLRRHLQTAFICPYFIPPASSFKTNSSPYPVPISTILFTAVSVGWASSELIAAFEMRAHRWLINNIPTLTAAARSAALLAQLTNFWRH